MKIRLGYLGCRGDRDAWRRFGGDIFGLQPVASDEAMLLRADERSWRLSVAQEEGPPLRYVGLELDSFADLDGLEHRLSRAGYAPVRDDMLARERRVSRLLRVDDPDGIPLEFHVGALVDPSPFLSPIGAAFVTGTAGLGHVLLSVSDLGASLRFYMDVVGLRRSDILEMGNGVEGHFLNGGFRHHVVALAQVPGLVGLHHIFVEVDSVLTVGRAWDRIRQANIPIVSQLGQHANDPAFSFYVESPSGFAVEYGFGALTIDPENWVETRWNAPFLWGGGPVSQQNPGEKL